MGLRSRGLGLLSRLRGSRIPWAVMGVIGCIAAAEFLVSCLGSGTLGRFGKAVEPPTIKGAVYVGWEACLLCHEDQAKKMEHSRHGKILQGGAVSRTALQQHGCEACHGPGSEHIADPTDPAKNIRFGPNAVQPVVHQNAVCLQCHGKGKRLFWHSSPHEMRDLSCVTCHSIKTPRSFRAQLKTTDELALCTQCHAIKKATFQHWSRMPVKEGKVQCSSCHNVHGTVTESLITESSVNEQCYRCHTEKRGPFLWEHPPVRESCLNCHDAHGSNNVSMLRIRAPRLCQQCHNERRHPSTAFSNLADRRVLGKGCVACHQNIHGSNHPSGFSFRR